MMKKITGKQTNETVSIFDKYADQYQDRFMSYEPYVESWKHLSTLLKPDAVVLDVACGPGNISKCLIQDNPALTIQGIDLSPKMLALAQLNVPSAVFQVMDSRDIALFKQQFDAIVCGFSFPYLSKEEVSTFIVDARSKLHSGGIFYISTMEGDYANSGYPPENAGDKIYTYYYHADELSALLTAAGFTILHIERKPFEVAGSPTATDLFIYARAV